MDAPNAANPFQNVTRDDPQVVKINRRNLETLVVMASRWAELSQADSGVLTSILAAPPFAKPQS